MWESEDSSYITTIIASEYAVLDIYNTSFEEHRVIPEEITSQGKSKFTTTLNNPNNGYSVKIKYALKDSNTIVCSYSGDTNEKFTLTRLY
jgi:flagellar hook assembly protein FlgD